MCDMAKVAMKGEVVILTAQITKEERSQTNILFPHQNKNFKEKKKTHLKQAQRRKQQS